MHAKHLIPDPGQAYDIFFVNVRDYVQGKTTPSDAPEWDFIPSSELAELRQAYSDWHAAYLPTTKIHTPAETAGRNAAWKRSKQVLSRFIQVWFRGFPSRVTDADLLNMSIPPLDRTRTPVPPPEIQVEADLTFPGIHLVELRRIRHVAGTASDARSDYGVRIYYGLTGQPSARHPFRLDGPLTDAMELPYSVFTRRAKERFDFNGESGSKVYFCLRYENSKGQSGPFGPVLSAVIP
ncbi:MAG: hypothetical protein LBD85_04435 [Oscillospiraceae bacterium]|jgi:hypothetical protein|nr:hypothetical protein [Oscillospiraceae bacterium]